MDFGVFFFSFALFPVLIFLYALRILRQRINDPKSRRLATVSTAIIMVFAPMVITGFMTLESMVDPEFMGRSFINPDGAGPFEIYMFALDQTLKGTMFDVMETFHFSIAQLEHKCDSTLFCVALLLYRTAVGAALSIFLLTWFLRLQLWGGRLFGSKKVDDGVSDQVAD